MFQHFDTLSNLPLRLHASCWFQNNLNRTAMQTWCSGGCFTFLQLTGSSLRLMVGMGFHHRLFQPPSFPPQLPSSAFQLHSPFHLPDRCYSKAGRAKTTPAHLHVTWAWEAGPLCFQLQLSFFANSTFWSRNAPLCSRFSD